MSDPESAQSGLRRNDRANFERLLDEMIERPEAEAALTAEIDRDFGEDRAVLVLDMTGFARTTRSHGIAAFLLMIYQMKMLTTPCIEAAGGVVVKSEADNLYCLFPDVDSAVRGSQAIMARLAAETATLPSERRLYASIGIGYGRILNVEASDIFGDEVNLASKLGEDIAQQGEILLTPAARTQVPALAVREESVSISGMRLTYFALL